MPKHNLPRSIISLNSPHRPLILPLFPNLDRTLQFTTQSRANQTENPRPIIDARSLAANRPPSNAPRFTIRRHPTGRASGSSDSNTDPSSRPVIDARSLAADPSRSNAPRFTITRENSNRLHRSNDNPANSRSRPPRKSSSSSPSFLKKPRKSSRSADPNSSASTSNFNYKADLAAFNEERAAYEAELAELAAPKPVPINPQVFDPAPASGAQIPTGVEGMRGMWAAEVEKVRWMGELQARGWEGWGSEREKEEGEARLKGSNDAVEKLLGGQYQKERVGTGKGVVERVVGMNSSYGVGDERRLVGRVAEVVERPKKAAK